MTDDSVGFRPTRWCPSGLASLFYRVDEIHNLSFKASLLAVTVSVFFPKGKKDQYREGQTSLLAMSQSLFAKFLLPRGYSNFFLPLESLLRPLLDKLLNQSLRSIFMLRKAFHTQRLKRNLGLKYVEPFVDNI